MPDNVNTVERHYLDSIYECIIVSLKYCADLCVPKQRKKCQVLWSQELDCLKAKAIESNKLWQEVGRPRSGPVYAKRYSDKRAYRLAIRRAEADTKDVYSNELHDLLLRKEGNEFWKSWNAKFKKRKGTPNKVDGHLDPDLIIASFVRHFKSVFTDTKTEASLNLQAKYIFFLLFSRPSFTRRLPTMGLDGE